MKFQSLRVGLRALLIAGLMPAALVAPRPAASQPAKGDGRTQTVRVNRNEDFSKTLLGDADEAVTTDGEPIAAGDVEGRGRNETAQGFWGYALPPLPRGTTIIKATVRLRENPSLRTGKPWDLGHALVESGAIARLNLQAPTSRAARLRSPSKGSVYEADVTGLVRRAVTDGDDALFRVRFSRNGNNNNGSDLARFLPGALEIQYKVLPAPSGGMIRPMAPAPTDIVFKSTRDGGDTEISIMEGSGANQTRLTNSAGFDSAPALSPDGTKIVWERIRNSNSDIYLLTIKDSAGNNTPEGPGNPAVRLTDDPAIDAGATWHPNGTRIGFSSSRSGGSANTFYTKDLQPESVGNPPVASSLTGVYNPAYSPNGEFWCSRDIGV